METDWTPLRQELAACRRDGVAVPFWWRDDDAIEPTAALDELAALSRTSGVAVHLAVIPARTTPALADYTKAEQMVPVVHGWMHRDHSGPGEKKNEFLTDRPDLATDAARGLEVMQTLFGRSLRPIFVPPWNRIRDTLLPVLAEQGFTALSTFGARSGPQAAAGLMQINTHIDPIWWKGTRDLVEPGALIQSTVAHLRARRQAEEDATEPLGLLTHHLVHTPAIWAFTEAFIHEILSGGATPWTMETT
ncbi:polysaccharide deacetylase family protein [Tateyamaria omphalii]|uniref:polysaccharide deacetylase family protein n=1 Tax=Tateyamaria omphalii TaxID=299262 RepID=UPI001C99611A|nr:polysaccharide deacetylase family protein [Tateyamaria omphalii]MBY5935327.1 polysaccharide deacetylase family protein [Tateyamaria omphalii]